MNRVTIAMLKYKIDCINKALGMPLTPYDRNESGMKANIGNYHLYQAYGSVGVHKICNEGGGIIQVFGLETKRETYNNLCEYLVWIHANKFA